MKFFVSWTKREPIFHDYDPSCKILISPVGVPLDWSVSEWKNFPKELFVDSGAFSIRGNKIPSCTEVLQRQLFITAKWPKNKKLYFSHPDILIPLNSNFKDQNDIIKFSLERAKEYFAVLSKTSNCAIPIGVIHGFDEESILNSHDFLKSIGYRYFALGSIGIRLARDKKISLRAIDIVQKYNIKPIHLFGITLPLDGNARLSKDIDSFDSSTATKLAFYGTVLYGSPLQRYIISPTAKQKYHDRCFTFRKHLSSPLPCECPVCKIDPNKLLSAYDPNAKFNRILHNYFQIKWELEIKN